MPTVTRVSDVSVICLVTYCQFPIQFPIYRSPHQASPALRRTIGFNMQYRTSDVAKIVGRYLSCVERTIKGKDFELILMVNMETRHRVEGQFDSDFLAICNHSVVMMA